MRKKERKGETDRASCDDNSRVTVRSSRRGKETATGFFSAAADSSKIPRCSGLPFRWEIIGRSAAAGSTLIDADGVINSSRVSVISEIKKGRRIGTIRSFTRNVALKLSRIQKRRFRALHAQIALINSRPSPAVVKRCGMSTALRCSLRKGRLSPTAHRDLSIYRTRALSRIEDGFEVARNVGGASSLNPIIAASAPRIALSQRARRRKSAGRSTLPARCALQSVHSSRRAAIDYLIFFDTLNGAIEPSDTHQKRACAPDSESREREREGARGEFSPLCASRRNIRAGNIKVWNKNL